MPNSLTLLAASGVIQLVLIAALIAQWRRGRRTLQLLAQHRAGVDERTAELVHELNQPLTAILSNAQAAQRFLSSAQPDVQELREILNDIVRDDKRAAGIVRSLGELQTKVLVAAHDRTKDPGDNRGIHKERTQ